LGQLTAGLIETPAGISVSSQRYKPRNPAIRCEGMTQSACTAATGRNLQQGITDQTGGQLPGAKIGANCTAWRETSHLQILNAKIGAPGINIDHAVSARGLSLLYPEI
jgi:hypothetical protein